LRWSATPEEAVLVKRQRATIDMVRSAKEDVCAVHFLCFNQWYAVTKIRFNNIASRFFLIRFRFGSVIPVVLWPVGVECKKMRGAIYLNSKGRLLRDRPRCLRRIQSGFLLQKFSIFSTTAPGNDLFASASKSHGVAGYTSTGILWTSWWKKGGAKALDLPYLPAPDITFLRRIWRLPPNSPAQAPDAWPSAASPPSDESSSLNAACGNTLLAGS
jgi:hypothetical protein